MAFSRVYGRGRDNVSEADLSIRWLLSGIGYSYRTQSQQLRRSSADRAFSSPGDMYVYLNRPHVCQSLARNL
jgi:hypothetical protein